MHLTSGNQVHNELVLIQKREYTGEEAMGNGFPVGMDVYHHDIVFYRYSCRTSVNLGNMRYYSVHVVVLAEVVWRRSFASPINFVRENNCSLTQWILYVFYPYRDSC